MYYKNYYKNLGTEEIARKVEEEGFNPIMISNSPNYIYHPHTHPETKLLAILEGSMEVKMEGKGESREVKVNLEKGDKLIIDGNVLHSAKVGPQGCKFFWSEKLI